MASLRKLLSCEFVNDYCFHAPSPTVHRLFLHSAPSLSRRIYAQFEWKMIVLCADTSRHQPTYPAIIEILLTSVTTYRQGT